MEVCNNNRDGIVKVNDLFVPSEKKWVSQMVHSLFLSCDAKAILETPVPQTQVADHMAWVYSVDGKYRVKTGYQFWHNTTASNVS